MDTETETETTYLENEVELYLLDEEQGGWLLSRMELNVM
jgi:hypothetical protein